MHVIDWKWCPRVAAHEITRNFLVSQARLQKARQTLEAYGRDLDDLLEAFSDLPFNDLIEADSDRLDLYIEVVYPLLRVGLCRGIFQAQIGIPNIRPLEKDTVSILMDSTIVPPNTDSAPSPLSPVSPRPDCLWRPSDDESVPPVVSINGSLIVGSEKT